MSDRISFKAMVRSGGPSYVCTVPKAYVENKVLRPGRVYRFEVVEMEEQENEPQIRE